MSDTEMANKGNAPTASISGTLMASRNRLLKFIQKRFSLLLGEGGEGPLCTIENIGCGDAYRRDTSSGAVDMRTSGGEDIYNLVEEDMPVVLNLDGIDLSPQARRESSAGNASAADGAAAIITSESVHAHTVSEQHAWTAFDKRVAGTGTALGIGSIDKHVTMDSQSAETEDMAIALAADTDNYTNNDTINCSKMSAAEVEAGLFSWRYPDLYDSRLPGEDMVMAAARTYEAHISRQSQSKQEMECMDHKKSKALAEEARRFLENEVSRQLRH